MALKPNAGQVILILDDVSRSHTTTHPVNRTPLDE